jgi:hypothetical protein
LILKAWYMYDICIIYDIWYGQPYKMIQTRSRVENPFLCNFSGGFNWFSDREIPDKNGNLFAPTISLRPSMPRSMSAWRSCKA